MMENSKIPKLHINLTDQAYLTKIFANIETV